jgi:phosphoribosylamine--glycine ligase
LFRITPATRTSGRNRASPAATAAAVCACPETSSTTITGQPITLPSFRDDLRVYHAGTSLAADGSLRTSGGRVFAVTAMADTFADAQEASRQAASRIEFEGAIYRGDIGWREAARLA